MPDAAAFGDEGAHTLGNIYAKLGKLEIPNLYALGLGHIKDARLPKTGRPVASFGRLAAKTKAKDTTSGHWELAGLIMDPPFATFEEFPVELLLRWMLQASREGLWLHDGKGRLKWQDIQADNAPNAPKSRKEGKGNSYKHAPYLANRPASGTQIIDEYGKTHMHTGAPIVYTSADSVFQVAAHEEVIPLKTQYRLCQIARELLVDDYIVGRVIARPFIGTPGSFTRTKNRKDFAVPPIGETLLQALEAKGQTTLGIGKIDDIFCNVGVANSNHTTNNTDGINATIDALKNNNQDTIIFTNLVDFDMHYGHRSDVEGYGKALEYFDTRLPEIQQALRTDDLLIITADHGCDPTTSHTDHTREYVPVLAYSKQTIKAIDLGTRDTFADVAATIYDALGHGAWPVGVSFFPEI